MSAHYFGSEVKRTKRYEMGKRVGNHARNLLLMTATPHNGKEEDFQLFMALLDEDRFAGHQRDAVHRSDPTDLMRRLVKEDLYTFQGTKLFPERKSYTAEYELSDAEKVLYERVTEYVREEMNRADRNANQQGGGKKRVNVGFALMTLQRRLASSPFCDPPLPGAQAGATGEPAQGGTAAAGGPRCRSTGCSSMPATSPRRISDDEIDELYEEDTAGEIEGTEEAFTDNATSAQTLAELELEIETLKELEKLSKKVVDQRTDAKWQELDRILDDPLMKQANGARRKLVLFTEFKDTLTDLAIKIRDRLGRPEAVVEIHGGVARDKRRQIVHAFMNDPEVVVLLANDAAGEGVNLQRAHLMVNYDLPWNPNRLEQRFGRIHRIGQKEVCHLWNLLAKDTREGDVYIQLLKKLEAAREALGDKVFDVLGQLFSGRSLRELLMDAVRYNEQPRCQSPAGAGDRGGGGPGPPGGIAGPAGPGAPGHGYRHGGAAAPADGAGDGPPHPSPLRARLLHRGLPAAGRQGEPDARRAATRSPTCRRCCWIATSRSASACRCKPDMSASALRRSMWPIAPGRSW